MMKRFVVAFFGLAAVLSPTAAGTIGKDKRQPIAAYAASHDIDLAEVRRMFGATGRIMCPFNAASAFLAHRADIVVSARHVVIPEPEMKAYAGMGRPHRCSFELSKDGITSSWHEVKVETIFWPGEKQRSPTDRFDWIIMKLAEPISGILPYALSDHPVDKGEDVTLVSLRQEGFPHEDWNERILVDCRVRTVLNIDNIIASGLKTGCSASYGASGGALLRRGESGMEVVGIQSSISPSCKKFSSTRCYSYAVGLSAEVRNAIRKLAEEP